MRTSAALLILASATVSARAQPPVDWTKVCDAVGNYAGLISAARDNKMPADAAMAQVGQILHDPPPLVPAVTAEITRQVYATPALSPTQETAALRARCLTPDQPPRPAQTPGNTAIVQPPIIAGLKPIELQVGVTRFATPAGNLDITLAWQDDGNGRGHDVFSATLQGAGPVAMPDGSTVSDNPANDTNMRRSVRFAAGEVNGTASVLLLITQRSAGPGATATLYQVYRLQCHSSACQFSPVLTRQLSGAYCNADQALSVASGLPLRASYRGPHTQDGCPASNS